VTPTDRKELLQIANALGPYRDTLVFAGAWCHRLLQFHPAATPPSFDPLMTEDADIATPDQLPSRSPSLDKALVAGGFTPELTGDGMLPVTKYYPVDENGLYIEFIAQLQGADTRAAASPTICSRSPASRRRNFVTSTCCCSNRGSSIFRSNAVSNEPEH